MGAEYDWECITWWMSWMNCWSTRQLCLRISENQLPKTTSIYQTDLLYRPTVAGLFHMHCSLYLGWPLVALDLSFSNRILQYHNPPIQTISHSTNPAMSYSNEEAENLLQVHSQWLLCTKHGLLLLMSVKLYQIPKNCLSPKSKTCSNLKDGVQ